MQDTEGGSWRIVTNSVHLSVQSFPYYRVSHFEVSLSGFQILVAIIRFSTVHSNSGIAEKLVHDMANFAINPHALKLSKKLERFRWINLRVGRAWEVYEHKKGSKLLCVIKRLDTVPYGWLHIVPLFFTANIITLIDRLLDLI